MDVRLSRLFFPYEIMARLTWQKKHTTHTHTITAESKNNRNEM